MHIERVTMPVDDAPVQPQQEDVVASANPAEVTADDFGGDLFADAGRDEPVANPLVAALKAKGYEIGDDATDQDVLSHYEALEKSRSEAEEYRRRLAEYEQRVVAEPARSPEPAQVVDDEPVWNPPKVDATAVKLAQSGILRRNENGLYESENSAFAPYVSQLNERLLYEEQALMALRENPYEFIGKAADARVKSVRKEYDERLAAMEKRIAERETHAAQQQIHDYFSQNANQFYQFDKSGNPVMDQSTGQVKLTPRGAAYAQAEGVLKDVIADPVKRHEAALKLAAVVPDSEPPKDSADRRVAFQMRSRTNGGTNRIATVPVRRRGGDPMADAPENHRELGAKFRDLLAQGAGEDM